MLLVVFLQLLFGQKTSLVIVFVIDGLLCKPSF